MHGRTVAIGVVGVGDGPVVEIVVVAGPFLLRSKRVIVVINKIDIGGQSVTRHHIGGSVVT